MCVAAAAASAVAFAAYAYTPYLFDSTNDVRVGNKKSKAVIDSPVPECQLNG